MIGVFGQNKGGEIDFTILREALVGLDGTVFLEFNVPRLGSRIDAVLLFGSALLVLEFKVGATQFNMLDAYQAWDYALDLKNFHSASREASIYPILVATQAESSNLSLGAPAEDAVFPPLQCGSNNLRQALRFCLSRPAGPSIDSGDWARAPYRPTPTIIEEVTELPPQD